MDEPQFRTVLRGYDQEQVASAITELQSSLATARRTAADRTIELAQVTEAKTGVEAELAELRSRSTAHDGGEPAAASPGGAAHPSRGFDQLGARLTTILSLAEEEAAQLRSTAADEARTMREEAAAAAAALRAESEQYAERVHERADGDVARMTSAATATSDAIVAQANEQADARRAEADQLLEAQRSRLSDERAQHEAWVADARTGAERVVAAAHEQAEKLRRQTDDELADAFRRRDAVHAHLAEVNQLLAALDDSLAGEAHAPHLEATHG